MVDKEKFYICRGCSVVSDSKIGGCSNCGKVDGPTVERSSLEGGTVEKQLPWYRMKKVVIE